MSERTFKRREQVANILRRQPLCALGVLPDGFARQTFGDQQNLHSIAAANGIVPISLLYFSLSGNRLQLWDKRLPRTPRLRCQNLLEAAPYPMTNPQEAGARCLTIRLQSHRRRNVQ